MCLPRPCSLNLAHDEQGPAHTTPEGFENGFTLKTHQMFFFHTAPKEVKRNNRRSFQICVYGNLSQGNHMIIVTLISKSSVFSVFHQNEKTAFSQ